MTSRKLRIALVGCGQIADAHLQEICKVPSATPVAVCDRHLDLARQAAARFAVPEAYDDLDRMLEAVRPDVLHITTPPQSHCAMSLRAIAAGAHVYVEKPFTVDAAEADRVLEAARAAGRQVCVGHDHLFDPVWEECRRLHRAGQFGRVVHVDSMQGYDLGGPFGKMFASEPDHWVHRLPGGLFQNVMSHAMYRITEFLPDESPRVWATWFGGAAPARAGTPTELRVMLRGAEVTANLVFSSTIRPVQRVARVHGTRESAEVDLDGRTIRTYRALRMPGPFAKLEAPSRHLREAARTLGRGLWKFARSEIQYFAGMHRLFTLFYRSVLDGTEPPIAPQEIRRVTAVMDDIFRACRAGADDSNDVSPSGRDGRTLVAPAGGRETAMRQVG